jgi:hypothetical protein
MSHAKVKRPPLALGFVIAITFLALMGSVASTGKAAAAPSAELARKCRDMMIKAYPPVRAGSPHGNAQKERDYFHYKMARLNAPVFDAAQAVPVVRIVVPGHASYRRSH